MAKKKYLFFDIDGTLLVGGYGKSYVPESTRTALDKLREAGHFLCIATGRSQALAVDIMHDLGFANMVSDGGYGLTLDDKPLHIRPLPKEGIIDLIEECKELAYPWGLQVDNSDTRLVPDDTFYDFTHDVYAKTRVVPGLDPANFDQIYKAYVACSYPGEYKMKTLDNLPWCRFHKEYIFVEPASKYIGIMDVMDRYHADYGDAIVFGDSKNDLTMFRDEWTKVAMGNACPELKEKADYITDDITKDGIYNICEKLGLFEKADEKNEIV